MKLPDFTALGERPSPAAPPPVVGYRPTSGFEQAPAEAMSHTGAELQQAADYLNKAQLEHDAVRAQDATNQGLSLQQDLTFGDNGFTKLKGGNAVNAPLLKDYGSAFDSKVQEIENTLENDNQKQAFRRRMGVAGLQMREDIVRHVAQEANVQADDTFKSNIDLNIQQASLRWSTPDSAVVPLLNIDDAIYKYAQRNGKPQEWVDDTKRKAADQVYSGIIGQALANKDYKYAQDFFDKHRDDISPKTAEAVGHAVYQGTQKSIVYNYELQYLDAKDDPDALKALYQSVVKDPNLDDEFRQKTTLLSSLSSRMETLNMRADRDEEKRLNRIGREMDSISRLSLQGVQPTPDRITALATNVKGTEYEHEFDNFIKGIDDQRKFSQLPPAQMRTQLEADMAEVAKNGGNEADRMRIQKRQQAYELAVSQLTQDPLAYNARTTGTDIPPVDMTNVATMQDSLRARQDILLALNKTHGSGVGLLRPDEAAQVRQMLRGMDATTRGAFLNSVYSAVGPGAVYSATMGQIAPDSPVTAFAGQLMGKGDVTVSHFLSSDTNIKANEVATRMLRGEDLLNPPSSAKNEDGKTRGFQIGPEKDFATSFNSAVGKAFPGAESQRVRDTYYQAAKAVYADLSLEAGDRSGVVDNSRAKKAVEMVTGGGVVKFGDSAVVPPFGMSSETLKGRVYQAFSTAVDNGQVNVPATMIKNASLYQVGDGRYLVQYGARFLPDEKTKQPLVIDVTGDTPTQVLPTNKQVKTGKR